MKCGGVIIEGVSGSGKSTLFNMLKASPLVRGFDFICFFPQVVTLRLAPKGLEGRYLARLLQPLEAFRRTYNRSNFAGRSDNRGSSFFLFEGFHFYLLTDRGRSSIPEWRLRQIEASLVFTNVKLVVLTVAPEMIVENCVRSTICTRGDGWKEFLLQFGSCEAEWVSHMQQRQEAIVRLAEDSALERLQINSTERKWQDYQKKIEQFIIEKR